MPTINKRNRLGLFLLLRKFIWVNLFLFYFLLTDFSTEACKLGTLINNWEQMIFLLYKLINSITVGTLTQVSRSLTQPKVIINNYSLHFWYSWPHINYYCIHFIPLYNYKYCWKKNCCWEKYYFWYSSSTDFLFQENVSCLNTTLVFLMFAHRHGRLPAYLMVSKIIIISNYFFVISWFLVIENTQAYFLPVMATVL